MPADRDKDLRWTHAAVPVGLALVLVATGAALFVLGASDFDHLREGLQRHGPSFVTSEVGLFFFGGIALLLVGLPIWLLGPKSATIDLERQEATFARGLLPRIPFQVEPLTMLKLRLERKQHWRQGRTWLVHELWLDLPRPFRLAANPDPHELRRRGKSLADRIGCPFQDKA